MRRIDGSRHVGIEHFQKVPKPLPLGFEPEFVVLRERFEIGFESVVERHRVQSQVDAARPLRRCAVDVPALHVIDGRRTKRPRRFGVNPAAANDVDVGGIVRAGGRRDGRVVEQPLFDRQLLARAGRHQHDIDNALLDDVANLLAVLGERFESDFPIVPLGRPSRRADAESHIGILGVGDDKLLASRRIGMNRGEFSIEGFFI